MRFESKSSKKVRTKTYASDEKKNSPNKHHGVKKKTSRHEASKGEHN
jgi:hypothetical protein